MNANTKIASEETYSEKTYDVVIAGGGWAGLCLARQVKMHQPAISVLILESSESFSAKVGEATVEMTGHYFMKHLGLVNYLYRRHLPKNGLRFFYDSPEHDLDIPQMSEHGTTSIPPHPAFQLDRARLEEDLVAMNREQGIEILMGAKVKKTLIHPEQDNHEIQFQHQNEKQTVACRWFVDAAGRARVLGRQFKLHSNHNVPKNCSVWGRFSGIQDIDKMGCEQWRSKAFGRFLSTNHFSGHGYWVWVIPLSGGHTSVGVVYEQNKMQNPPKNQQEFTDFLMSHKSLASLLHDAKFEDFEAWGQLAYRADEFISKDRWATTGFAAMFLDPLFSGGGDMIAITNDLIAQQIIQDISNDCPQSAQDTLNQQVPTCNKVAVEFYQSLYSHIANIYPVLDCGQLCSPLLAYSTAAYFLEAAWDYMAGNFVNLEYWQRKDFLRKGYLALELMLQNQTLATAEVLKNENRYFDANSEGFFDSGADSYKYFVYQMGEHGRDGWRIELRTKLWVEAFLTVTGVKLNLKDFAQRRYVQENLTMVDIFEAPLFAQPEKDKLFEKISAQFSQELCELLEVENGDVQIVIDDEAFNSDVLNIQYKNPDQFDEKEQKGVQSKANRMWMQKQDYITTPFMVPVFLSFARQQDLDIASTIIDQRTLSEQKMPTMPQSVEQTEAQI